MIDSSGVASIPSRGILRRSLIVTMPTAFSDSTMGIPLKPLSSIVWYAFATVSSGERVMTL